MRLVSAFFSLGVCAALAVACGGSAFTEASDGGGADASAGNDGSSADGATGNDSGGVSDAAKDVEGGGPRFNCADGGGFPPFDKTCSGGGCAVFLHTVDCCGSKVAYAIQHATLTSMEAAEQAWEQQCSLCGCPAKQTVGEDGCTSNTGQFVADCNNGRCEIKCL